MKKDLTKKIIVLLFIFSMFFGGIIFLWVSTFKIPDLDTISERRISESTKIYDRTGEVLLYDLHKDTKRTIIPYSEISSFIKNATVAIEDAEFYQHNGVKPMAFLRSVLANLKTMSFSQGGSTITQQVVKNSILTTEKKITRKLKEWVLAYKLEQIMTKDEILALYLNEAPYGGNIYGIEEASLTFFGKNSKDLTLIESAYLAAIPQAPTFYSPYGNNRDRLEVRKNLVLSQMFKNNFINEEDYLEAIKTELEFKKQEVMGIRAPHFVMYIKGYLENRYGKNVTEEGLKVITTLDYDLQEKGEEIAKRYALENTEKFNAENASLVAIDSKTGQILTMVGSRDYFDKNIEGNFNIALAHRQPGSAFKPFVYATAFNKGYTPETIVFDLQTEFSTTCNPDGTPINPDETEEDNTCYSPTNYDDIFRGPVSFRNALAQSINIPAIKALYLAGLSDSLQVAKDMGIEKLGDINQYGLTLVLGGGEVSLLDITNAYATFSNQGVKNPTVGILKIEDKNGSIIEEFKSYPRRVLPEQTALMISDVLSDNKARTPAFGAYSPLYFGNQSVAAKTGTTNDYRDAWIIGYSDKIAFGAWAGNNDNTSMEKKVAGFVVAPMWHDFVVEVLKKYPAENFEQAKKLPLDEIKPVLRGIWLGGETYVIDKISGKLVSEYTPEELYEEKVVQNIHSILYWVDKNNPLGPKPTAPENDMQFERWEYRVAEWALDNNFSTSTVTQIPTSYDDIHKPEYLPRFDIITPNTMITYDKNNQINVIISKTYSKYPILKKEFYINGIFIGSTQANKNFSFIPNNIINIKSVNTLKIVLIDSVYNKSIKTIEFKVQ
ncbi:MAG: transglycosylase domain-containing protein [Candidatus Pacebacteria bacterium]|nr:transglycosylase domain-containing protein [Candidatus Paceibacterota bacterium]